MTDEALQNTKAVAQGSEQPPPLPQMDVSSYVGQVFWLAIAFVFLYIVMSKISLPKVGEVLQNRRMRIANDIEKAEKLKLEAESTQADFTSAITEARQKASDLIAASREKIVKNEAKRFAKLEENFAKQSKESDQRIVQVKESAFKELVPVSSEVARFIAKKLLNTDVNASKATAIAEQLGTHIKKSTG